MVETRESNDILVALPHLRPVLAAFDDAAALAGSGGTTRLYHTPEESSDLGLARVGLPDVKRAADAVIAWAGRRNVKGVYNGIPQPSPKGNPLDRLLWHLRAGFAEENGGWAPTIGKNRAVGRVPGIRAVDPGVSGAGEISHGGGGAPMNAARPAWAARATSEAPNGVRVGLVDTEMVAHDDLAGAWVGPYRRGNADRPPYAERGHATFVAGLIHRHAPRATVHVYPALDAEGRADTWTVAHRMIEAGRAGVDILNLSFVCYTEDGLGPMVLAAALDRLSSDIVVVGAAGNHGFLTGAQGCKPAWPAAFPTVVAVGATGRDSVTPADFTPVGRWIDILAPGEDVTSTFFNGKVSVWQDPTGPEPGSRSLSDFTGYATWSGTSYAAGIVSGLIADGTEPGRTTATEAYDALLRTASPAGPPYGHADGPVVVSIR